MGEEWCVNWPTILDSQQVRNITRSYSYFKGWLFIKAVVTKIVFQFLSKCHIETKRIL